MSGAASGPEMLKEEVDEEDVAEVVAKWTGMPVSRLHRGRGREAHQDGGEAARRVVGQDEAIKAVANAMRRARGWPARSQPADRQLPLPGPDRRWQDRAGPGLGRVSLRRPEGHDAVDMSEYMEKHSVSRLVGGASRLRGLRRGRPTHRGRPPPALLR